LRTAEIQLKKFRRGKAKFVLGSGSALLLVIVAGFLAAPLHGQEQSTSTSKAANSAEQQSGASNQQVPEEVLQELSAMKKRIEQLEAALTKRC
jgi:hypothetical protein